MGISITPEPPLIFENETQRRQPAALRAAQHAADGFLTLERVPTLRAIKLWSN